MSFELIKKLDEEIWLKISGQFSVEDYQQTQSIILSTLEVHNQSKGLVILDNFTGWSKDSRWDEIMFMQEHADQITKIAIVGDEKWKDEFYMFVGKSFRSTGIEFFSQNHLELAKAWLSEAD